MPRNSLHSRPQASSSLRGGSYRHGRRLARAVSTRAAPAPLSSEPKESAERSSSSASTAPTSSRRDVLRLSATSSLLLLLLQAAPPPSLFPPLPRALAAPLVDEEEAEAAISKARSSVVSVLAARRGPSSPLSSLCSAVSVLPGGIVATAAHALTAAAGSPLLVKVHRGETNELVFPASVIGSDPTCDVALLRVDFSSLSSSSSSSSSSSPLSPSSSASLLPPLPFGPSSSLRVGQSLFIVGAPTGDGSPLATAGIVSGLKRAIALPQGSSAAAIPPLVTGALQTDAPFAGARWAGGAAVDSSGALVGIATNVRGGNGGSGGFGGREAGTTANGVGFALASDNVAAAIARIMR